MTTFRSLTAHALFDPAAANALHDWVMENLPCNFRVRDTVHALWVEAGRRFDWAMDDWREASYCGHHDQLESLSRRVGELDVIINVLQDTKVLLGLPPY